MLLLTWWVLLILAVLIYIEDPGPVIFKQQRIGLYGKEFTMWKMRSMKLNSEFSGSGAYSEANDPRLLKIGRIARATSADELIQAIHLIKGEMSLVGPRPPLTYHPWPIEEYTKEQMHMFDVRPGITGWAQINGRKGVEWHKRIDLNCWYADHVSLFLDIKIIVLTVFKVFANADNVNTGATVAETVPASQNEENG